MLLILSLLSSFAALVGAQQSVWGQCGGIGYTGPTTCASGSVCTYSNPYYSQCLPGTASSSSTTLVTKTSTSSSTSSSTSTPSGVTGTKYLITFGDSYSQTGFDVNGAHPSSSNPIGNPNFPGYTTDNGPNWIGDLVTVYKTSLTLSYNFAYGGATVDSALVAPYASSVVSLVQQVSQFSASIANHPSYAPWTSANTLFAIWIGINDVGNSWSNSNATEEALLQKIFDRLFGQVDILYQAGARNFAFLNLPPTNLTPLFVSEGTTAQNTLATVIASWNDLLVSRTNAFVASHASAGSGGTVSAKVVDTHTVFENILATGGNAAKCYNSDGVTCLWWDNYHAGQVLQKATAAAVAAAEKGTFF